VVSTYFAQTVVQETGLAYYTSYTQEVKPRNEREKRKKGREREKERKRERERERNLDIGRELTDWMTSLRGFPIRGRESI
jgi:hypothetical protein